MKFSIIVPVYNVEKYLEKCIQSLVEQTYKDFEVILVDDGSKDSSGEICDKYAEKYSFMKVIHQENRGLSGARNTGLKNAVGEWIAFVDSDDCVETNMLRILAGEIDKTDAELYSFNMQKVNYAGEVVEKLIYNVENYITELKDERQKFDYYFHILMQYKAGWEVCSRIFKRKIIYDNNLEFIATDLIFAEDYLFTFQYLLYVEKIGSLCNIFYKYYQRDQSILHNVNYKTVLERLWRFAEIGYQSVCEKNMKIFKKNIINYIL